MFVFIKVSWSFSTFLHRREGKNTKCAFEIDFFAICSAYLTCVNGSTIQFLLRELLFRINLWVFLIKIFKKLSYLSVTAHS